MQKILILGCPASGKSTLAELLSTKLNINCYHLDIIALTNHYKIKYNELKDAIKNIVKLDSFIIDGNYLSNLSERLKFADTVILLNIPVNICAENAKARINNKIIGMPQGLTQTKQEFKQFIDRIYNFDISIIIKQLNSDKPIYILNSYEDINYFSTNCLDNSKINKFKLEKEKIYASN